MNCGKFLSENWDVYLYIAQILVSETLFALPLKRRGHFPLRLAGGLAAFVALASVVPSVFKNQISGFITIYIFLLSFPLYFLCFENKFMDLLFCYVSALVVQNLSYSAGVLASQAFGISPDVAAAGFATGYVQTPVYIIATALCFFICRRKLRGQNLGMRSFMIVVIAAVSIFFIIFLHVILKKMNMQYFWPATLLFLFSDTLLLIMLYGLFERSKLKNEIIILEQLMEKERKQYIIGKETIDLINFKCHDLKHQIAALTADGGTDKEKLAKLQRDILIYEQSAKTGNATLDVILSEKILRCESNKITLTYMADGGELAGMDALDVASVFGNLLDNAIDYLVRVPEEKRNITLVVRAQSGFLTIHTENYCSEAYEFANGLPKTTSGDADMHGYGLKSVRYIVGKYGGNFVASLAHETFAVSIIVPIPIKPH